MHWAKSIECTTQRVNSKVNCALQVMMLYQCRFILGKNSIILVSDIDNGGRYARMAAGGIGEISMLSSQFHCKSKSVLIKTKSLEKNKVQTNRKTQRPS